MVGVVVLVLVAITIAMGDHGSDSSRDCSNSGWGSGSNAGPMRRGSCLTHEEGGLAGPLGETAWLCYRVIQYR